MANFYGADSMTQCFGTKDSEGVIIVEVITWERVPVRDYVDGGPQFRNPSPPSVISIDKLPPSWRAEILMEMPE